MKQQINSRTLFRKTFFLGKEFFFSNSVYDPAEDSFLLSENALIPSESKVLDLGCGTGIQGINAFMKCASKIFFTDINPDALKCAEKNALIAGMKKGKNFKLVKSDLFLNLKKEKFDVILFNPPYVLSSKKNHLALDGGKKGRELLDRFLDGFSRHLNENGRAFFVQSSLNGLNETKKILSDKGFSCNAIAKKRLFFEELFVIESHVII